MTIEEKIEAFISQDGVTAYRKVKWNKEKGDFDRKYIDIDSINTTYVRANFNTQVAGGIAIFLEKDGIEYYFGLRQKNEVVLTKS